MLIISNASVHWGSLVSSFSPRRFSPPPPALGLPLSFPLALPFSFSRILPRRRSPLVGFFRRRYAVVAQLSPFCCQCLLFPRIHSVVAVLCRRYAVLLSPSVSRFRVPVLLSAFCCCRFWLTPSPGEAPRPSAFSLIIVFLPSPHKFASYGWYMLNSTMLCI